MGNTNAKRAPDEAFEKLRALARAQDTIGDEYVIVRREEWEALHHELRIARQAVEQLTAQRKVLNEASSGWDRDSTEAIAVSIENSLFELSFASPEDI